MSIEDIAVAIRELSKVIDFPRTLQDKGVMLLALKESTATALAGAEGDYIPLIVDANGRLHVLDQNSADVKAAVEAINTALQTAGITQVQLAAAVTALQIIDNIVSGSEAQVDVVAALPAGTNNIGDVDIATIAAGTTVIGKVRLVTAAGDEITDDTQNDILTHRGKAGLLNSGVRSADTAVKASAGALYWLTVSDTAALAIEINDSINNGGSDVWALDLPAGGYAHFIFDPPIECGTGIYLDVSTATCKVTLGYI